MNVRRLTTRAAFLLLALVICSGGALPQQRHSGTSESATALGVGQSIALSDFDADGLIDEARLEGSSLRKSVGILLSGTGKRLFLHLNSIPVHHGSLLAQDVDSDGATDLIWTDAFRAAAVEVWLGDGNGRFVEVDPGEYGRGFTLGNTDVAEPDGSNPETAINFETPRPLDQLLSPKYLDRSAIELPNEYPDRHAVSSPPVGHPAGRDPPVLLS